MCFNPLLNRTGHFWEQRYHNAGIPNAHTRRALNTLRYIHANPKACGLRRGFLYDFSNYGSYQRFNDDGITDWHPAFLKLAPSLDECSRHYRNFCRKYRPQTKPKTPRSWGRSFIGALKQSIKIKILTAQRCLERCQVTKAIQPSEITSVADKFTLANGH